MRVSLHYKEHALNCVKQKQIFWDVKPCSLVEFYNYFGSFPSSAYSACCFLGLFFNDENGGNMFLQNVSKLISSQKTQSFIFTALKPSNLKQKQVMSTSVKKGLNHFSDYSIFSQSTKIKIVGIC
jgi:hypothetical protein